MEKMRGVETKREAVRRYARDAHAIIGCACFFWAAAGAHSSPEPSHTHASKPAQEKRVDWVAGWTSVVERELDHWVPTKENDRIPMAAVRRPQTDISGAWGAHRILTGTSITISRSGPDSYDIALDTHGCCGWWKLRRTGSYSGGVLVLNRPVEEYFPLTDGIAATLFAFTRMPPPTADASKHDPPSSRPDTPQQPTLKHLRPAAE